MKNRTEILNELNEWSPSLASISRQNVFSVPSDYFDLLPAEILAKIAVQNIEQGNKINFEANVPQGYFEQLPFSILQKIKAEEFAQQDIDGLNMDVLEETNAISPLVASIGNENVFEVPPAYFENVADDIVEGLPQPAKLVKMSQYATLKRYAAAASVAALIGLGSLFLFNNSQQQSNESNVLSPTVMADAKSIIQQKNFDQALDNLSDQDIAAYLQSNGTDVDAALVASAAAESNNLPAAEDYFLDENTLQQYLKELKIENNN